MILYTAVNNTENGYATDQVAAKSLIEEHGILSYFEVEYIDIDRSSSVVKMVGNEREFNTVNFEFFLLTEDGRKDYNIFENPLKLKHIRKIYLHTF
ncbi:hypothetical protein CPTAKMNP4_130 [Salmonella phage vB_SenM-AKM_NP4]|uniref:Uncharacterized protein n=2 Tax=Gelderlandvirus TaxID=1913653 RepID=M1EB81_BPS16|nr:hypothetical protein I133_gp141 [Salmonella phage vB_SenM-S16]YP_009126331.1 hypothetical protein STP4a_124 [Salmonella phage STP4-a]WDR21791.1 hypothetical protein PJM34_0123 [Salmonella phage vB_SenM_UTK0003]WLI71752.1 hypothetical protein CPTAKMNP4_130 [Salmonella phage vB_SenM-AKM_NP4]AEO97078.1 hypothetical protein [Salmonella phage vB_SenM-S16]AHJ86978.1 hypothetical protein STP4a_124 [Salmonella phage STP4-a]